MNTKNLSIKRKLQLIHFLPWLFFLLVIVISAVSVNRLRQTMISVYQNNIPKVTNILDISSLLYDSIIRIERFSFSRNPQNINDYSLNLSQLSERINDYAKISTTQEENESIQQISVYKRELEILAAKMFSVVQHHHELINRLETNKNVLEKLYEQEKQKESEVLETVSTFYASIQTLRTEILGYPYRRNDETGIETIENTKEKVSDTIDELIQMLSEQPFDTNRYVSFLQPTYEVINIATEIMQANDQLFGYLEQLAKQENAIIALTQNVIGFHKDYVSNKISDNISFITQMIILIVVLLILFVPVTYYFSFLMSRSILDSLNGLRAFTKTIASGNYDDRIVKRTNDEIGDLYEDFNKMAEELSLSRKDLILKVLSKIPCYVVVFDSVELTISFVNDLLVSDFPLINRNYSGKTLINAKLYDAFHLTKAFREEISDFIHPNRTIDDTKNFESIIGNKIFDNTIFYVSKSEEENLIGIFINDMTDAQFYQRQLINNEKLINLGKASSGIAHEINNPLFVISAKAEKIYAREDLDSVTRDAANYIVQKATVISDIVKNISTFSKTLRQENFTSVDINSVLKESLNIVRYGFTFLDIKVETDLSELPKFDANESELQQVFINLINNAIEAMRGKGILSLTSEFKHNSIVVSISDTGPGIKEGDKNFIFDLFYSTKNIETNSGQGLHIVKTILNRYNADITFDSVLGHHTTFIITFHLR